MQPSRRNLVTQFWVKHAKRLHTDLDYQRRRSQGSPVRRASRQLPSLSFKLKYLSPLSVAKRRQATEKERSLDKAKLAKFVDTEVTVDDEQFEELTSVMEKIEKTCKDESEKCGKMTRNYSFSRIRNQTVSVVIDWGIDLCTEQTMQ